MEIPNIPRRDRLNGVAGRITVCPESLALCEVIRLAIFNGGGIVVALFHGLQRLLFAQRNCVVLKSRGVKHVAQQSQTCIEILGKQVEAHAALGVADGGIELRAQKRDAFLELRRGIGSGAGV